MSRSRRTIDKGQPFETTYRINGKEPDTFTRIYESVLISEAFQDLSPQVQMLYICMRAQYYGKRKPNREYDESFILWDQIKTDDCFFFSRHMASKYMKKYEKNSSRLYRDIKVLEEHGFIETVFSGKSSKSKSVYKYSDKWKEWKPQTVS